MPPRWFLEFQRPDTRVPKLSKPIFELTSQDGQWIGARWVRKNAKGKEHGIEFNIEEANMVYTRLAEAILAVMT